MKSGETDLDLLRCVVLRLPVGYSAHPHFAVPKLLAEGSVLGLRVSTAVGVMEGHVEEKWPLLLLLLLLRRCAAAATTSLFGLVFLQGLLSVCLEELANQQFDAGDVSPDLEDGAVLLRVGKIKGVHRARPHVLLPNYTCFGSDNVEKATREKTQFSKGSMEFIWIIQIKFCRATSTMSRHKKKHNSENVPVYLCVCQLGRGAAGDSALHQRS